MDLLLLVNQGLNVNQHWGDQSWKVLKATQGRHYIFLTATSVPDTPGIHKETVRFAPDLTRYLFYDFTKRNRVTTHSVKTLRVEVNDRKRHWQPRSPAIAAGLSDHIWIEQLLTAVVAYAPINTTWIDYLLTTN